MGETVQLRSAKDGFAFDTYRAAPTDARRGGLVICHAIWGVTPHLRELADSFAEDGYEVLVPSLFDRFRRGFAERDTDPALFQRQNGFAESVGWGVGVLDAVQAAIDALRPPVVAIGFCFGGTVAWLAAARADGINHMGWAVSGEDAYAILRGLRTLPVRMERQGASGLRVAAWLRDQPEVAALFHPALPGCPDHALWARDFKGACGLFGFALRPAPEAAVDAFLDALTVFGLGFSWGGFESLAISCDPQLKPRRFPKDYGGPLIRLHVGLEDPDDLIADLRRGLDAYGRLAG